MLIFSTYQTSPLDEFTLRKHMGFSTATTMGNYISNAINFRYVHSKSSFPPNHQHLFLFNLQKEH